MTEDRAKYIFYYREIKKSFNWANYMNLLQQTYLLSEDEISNPTVRFFPSVIVLC